MSAEAQRKLLEQLMGKEAMYGSGIQKLDFTDASVCKDYLCGLCPHDLFPNTKMDVGPCPRKHIESCKIDYERAKKEGKHQGFEVEWTHSLADFVGDCDRKVQQGLRKMERYPEENKAIQMVSFLFFYTLIVIEKGNKTYNMNKKNSLENKVILITKY